MSTNRHEARLIALDTTARPAEVLALLADPRAWQLAPADLLRVLRTIARQQVRLIRQTQGTLEKQMEQLATLIEEITDRLAEAQETPAASKRKPRKRRT